MTSSLPDLSDPARLAGHVVDIGIPTYGDPVHLAEAIESVLGQRFAAWRLTVQENGVGSEAVRERIEPFVHDPRISYRATGTPVSAAENWSRLIQRGTAPYVALLHDDDRWEPNFLGSRVEMLEQHEQCGFAFGPAIEIDGSGRERTRRPIRLPAGVYRPEEFILQLYRRNLVAAPSPVVRRSAYQAVGPAFSDRFSMLTDYEMWFRLALRFPVACVDTYEAAVRVHDQSVTLEPTERATVKHVGEQYVEFCSHMEKSIRRDMPGVRLPRRLSRKKRSYALVKAALDSVEDNNRGDAVRQLGLGLVVYPPSLIDPRVPAALVAIAGGERGARLIARLRLHVFRNELRIHRRREWPL